MPRFVTFKLSDDSTVVVEVEEFVSSERVMRGGVGGVTLLAESDMTFQAAIGNVKKAAEAMLEGLQSLAKPADELSLEFGVKLTAETGAVIAKASADAHFQVTLKWGKK